MKRKTRENKSSRKILKDSIRENKSTRKFLSLRYYEIGINHESSIS